MEVFFKYLLHVLLAWALTTLAWAEQVVDLYQAQSLVSSQSSAERAQATADGLAEVIVRVSGSPGVLQEPRVIDALRSAQRYVYEFRYESTDEVLLVDRRELAATRIVLKFSAQAIEKLLRQAQLPMWPANRHSVLVWLVMDDAGRGRQLIGKVEYPQHIKALAEAGTRRGLPIITPLLDLQDQMALSAADTWRMDERKVRAASVRYQADSILVGRYSRTSRGEWRATWWLSHKQGSQVFDSAGFDLQTLISTGIDQVANNLASVYAIFPGDRVRETVVMKLDGIGQFGRYIDVINYLKGLAMVRRADVATVDGDTLTLHLYTEGELGLLIDALALDKKLKPVISASANQLGAGPGVPQWQGPRGTQHNPLHYHVAAR